MSMPKAVLAPARGTAATHAFSLKRLTAPLFIALLLSAVGDLLTSPDTLERLIALTVSP